MRTEGIRVKVSDTAQELKFKLDARSRGGNTLAAADAIGSIFLVDRARNQLVAPVRVNHCLFDTNFILDKRDGDCRLTGVPE